MPSAATAGPSAAVATQEDEPLPQYVVRAAVRLRRLRREVWRALGRIRRVLARVLRVRFEGIANLRRRGARRRLEEDVVEEEVELEFEVDMALSGLAVVPRSPAGARSAATAALRAAGGDGGPDGFRALLREDAEWAAGTEAVEVDAVEFVEAGLLPTAAPTGAPSDAPTSAPSEAGLVTTPIFVATAALGVLVLAMGAMLCCGRATAKRAKRKAEAEVRELRASLAHMHSRSHGGGGRGGGGGGGRGTHTRKGSVRPSDANTGLAMQAAANYRAKHGHRTSRKPSTGGGRKPSTVRKPSVHGGGGGGRGTTMPRVRSMPAGGGLRNTTLTNSLLGEESRAYAAQREDMEALHDRAISMVRRKLAARKRKKLEEQEAAGGRGATTQRKTDASLDIFRNTVKKLQLANRLMGRTARNFDDDGRATFWTSTADAAQAASAQASAANKGQGRARSASLATVRGPPHSGRSLQHQKTRGSHAWSQRGSRRRSAHRERDVAAAAHMAAAHLAAEAAADRPSRRKHKGHAHRASANHHHSVIHHKPKKPKHKKHKNKANKDKNKKNKGKAHGHHKGKGHHHHSRRSKHHHKHHHAEDVGDDLDDHLGI